MSDLMTETMRLARECEWPVAAVCQAAGVRPRWYHKFIAGEFSDPGVTKVERLNKALKTLGRERPAA